MKKCWSCACIPISWPDKKCRRSLMGKKHLETALRGYPEFPELPRAQWDGDARKFFLHVSKKEQKRPFPRAHRSAGKELEVFRERRG